jgi:hypothetical protein
MINDTKIKISMLVMQRHNRMEQEKRGTRNINRDCEKNENRSADLKRRK